MDQDNTQKPFVPNAYSVQTYLVDTNQLLTNIYQLLNNINQNLNYGIQQLLELNAQKDPVSEKEKLVKVIGEK